MTQCQICNLKTKYIRQNIRNLIKKIKTLQMKQTKGFKDHTYKDPFSKLLNMMFKNQIKLSDETIECSLHNALKHKILNYLKISQQTLMKKSQIILMSQIKSNYILDILSSKIKQMPLRIPKLIDDHRKQYLKLKDKHNYVPKEHRYIEQKANQDIHLIDQQIREQGKIISVQQILFQKNEQLKIENIDPQCQKSTN